jgi:hypothetical protein
MVMPTTAYLLVDGAAGALVEAAGGVVVGAPPDGEL